MKQVIPNTSTTVNIRASEINKNHILAVDSGDEIYGKYVLSAHDGSFRFVNGKSVWDSEESLDRLIENVLHYKGAKLYAFESIPELAKWLLTK